MKSPAGIVLCICCGLIACGQPATGQTLQPPLAVALPDDAKMEFVWIPPGVFMMGAADGPEDERPVRRVTVGRGFWIGKYEVTQDQFCAVTHRRPSINEGDKHPV